MSIFDSVKEASQKAEKFALNKQLREAVTTAETALNMWAEEPSFWEMLVGKILIGNLVERLQKQLVEWRNQVAEADKLAARANLILRNDIGDPFVTQGISDAIALYRLYSIILEDEQVLYSIQQCQQELQKRKQFQELVKQAESQAENRFFKNAIAIYQEAEKLYTTESVKQAFTDALTQVPHEESYNSALRKAKEAESEGNLQAAIILLDSALTNFPRADGLDILQKLKATVKGRELFCQGLAAEKAGDFPAAKSLYENAYTLLPNLQESQIRLGIVAIKMQDWATALSYLQGLSGQQAAYLRGFALAQQANLQLAYWEWQNVSATSINEQRKIIQDVFQYQYSLSLHNIEELVRSKQWEKAKTASREFIQKFGANALVETNLKEHIQPSLEAAVWKDSDWKNIAPKMENIWIVNPNITTLHNWTVATYYHAQSNPEKLIDLIIALSTAIANLNSDSSLQNIPWLGNKAVDFNFISLELKRRLEAAIDNIKNTNIENYLNLRDYLRWQIVALRFMGEPANSGMQINDVFITPGCYHKFSSQWQSTIVYKIHSSQKILHSLYTHWGLAVAACLEGDRQRAIQLKPTNNHTIEVEQFAHNFVAYHEGCYHLQQQKWQAAITPWQQAKLEIKDHQDWQQEIDRLCNLQRQVISEFQEHLEFSQFWYDIIDTQSAISYLAEYQAEEIRQQLINKQISLKQALKKLQKLKNIDSNNPVVNDMIENVEFDQEIEEINRLFKTRKHEEMVRKARNSKRDRVRYIVAEFFIDLLIKGMEEGTLNDPEVMLQLGRWAYEVCPNEPAFQEIYRGLKFC
ncbi:peptidase M, neutral zinc metallopeptidase site [Anabaena sp. WFMT]|uniref:peptidase M, neutral zinc metallopeptidase site n=1 Tax=Anabaena sp. WFMT TaxID=3449730 RepID=UPI003F1F1D80